MIRFATKTKYLLVFLSSLVLLYITIHSLSNSNKGMSATLTNQLESINFKVYGRVQGNYLYLFYSKVGPIVFILLCVGVFFRKVNTTGHLFLFL